MPDLDQTRAIGARISGATSGRTPSRRSVLRTAAGAGAAGIAASALGSLAAVPLAAASGETAATPTTHQEPHAEAVVVHVRDVTAGEIDVFRGTTVTRVHDKALAARIVQASR